MGKSRIFLLFLLGTLVLNDQQAVCQSGKRIIQIINERWTFNYFPEETADQGFEHPDFDDSAWPEVSIPHTWSTYETTGQLHPYIHDANEKSATYWWYGWGWYRKHFSINPDYSGKKVFVEFEGVQKYCKVWINGHYLGEHKGGYGSFDFDLTSYIKNGKDNVLAIAVCNRQNDQFRIPPMAAGNFDLYGGIYRDVTISVKDKLYIPMQGSASHEGGTFVTTPAVSEKQGVVRVQTWVKNDYGQAKKCALKTSIVDAEGKVIQVLKSEKEIKPGEMFKFDQISKNIQNPHLWSHENPYLYKVYSEVIDGENVVDDYESPLGFRWFWWDYKENFLYVNGKKMIIHGGNRHQEYPWLGDAIPKWITQMDYKDIAENLNYNFMRTAHYPNDKQVYELTDKYGIAIDEESPSIKNQVFSTEVQEQQIKEAIRRDRNHPSIMFWSMGNETNHAVDSKYAIKEDTTRIITARRVLDGSAGAYAPHSDENLGIESLLRCTIRGWYNTDVKDLEPKDSQHCGTEEHQQNMLIESGRMGTGNLCTWIYEDHGCDRKYVNSPLLFVNPKGYVDSYRIPKYAYYLWQATYYPKPMVFILPHFWRMQYLGQKKDIRINSNCDTVELKVNGKSLGFQYPSGSNVHSVTFKNVEVCKGNLSAVGHKNGQVVTTEVTMAGEPAKLVLTSSHQEIEARRSSVVIIKADIVDHNGVHVIGATNTVKWAVSGPATLVGPSIYETDINKHEETEGTMYTDMPVCNVIRSTGKPGKIHVFVSSSGLASGSVDVEAKAFQTDNSVIVEPLIPEGKRVAVTKNINTNLAVLPVPREMKETIDEFNLKPASIKEYSAIVRLYIEKKNKKIDTTSIEFKTLVKLFASHLANNYGRLVADDYNFSVNHYNACRQISKFIDSTDLSLAFKKGLKKFYAETIIKNGMEKNYLTEKQWINGIPTKGTVVMIKQEGKNQSKADENVVMTNKKDLSEIISDVIPEFKTFNQQQKSIILEYVSKINPYITVVSKTDQTRKKKDGGDEAKRVVLVHYVVKKGEPVLLPPLNCIPNLKN